MFLSRFQNNSGPKSSTRSVAMHGRISEPIVDRSASKSPPLNSHLVLNSLTYFSTAPDVHDHFLRNVRCGFRREGLFSLTFHVASPLPHLSESCGFPSYSRRKLVHHHLGLFAICQHCCPQTVPNSVQTIWPAQNGENISRAFAAM